MSAPPNRSVFTKTLTVTMHNALCINTLSSTLGIQITEVGADFLRGRMSVDQRTHQHLACTWGASVALPWQ